MSLLESALLTDLYQLTMLHAYFAHGMRETAVFELFVRKLPANRNFLMAAGLEQALTFLEQLRFTPEELEWVERSGRFGRGFAAHLAALRFTGDVHAMPEGTVFFPDEPVLRVTAPFPEAQLVESRLINLVHFETLVASKACPRRAGGAGQAARGLRLAPRARRGSRSARRARELYRGIYRHGDGDGGVRYGNPGIRDDGPLVRAGARRRNGGFRAFRRNLSARHDAADRHLRHGAGRAQGRGAGRPVEGAGHPRGRRQARQRRSRGARPCPCGAYWTRAGLTDATIFASGNLDEYRVRDLVSAGAPIDGFGIGTSLVTSSDAPFLDAVYKLQEYAGKPRRKRSTGKATWPGRKQVYRHYDARGRLEHDVVTVESDTQPGEPLLVPVMKNGRRLHAVETLDLARSRAAAQLASLPERLRPLETSEVPYRVEIAPALRRLAAEVDRMTGEIPALLR